MIQAHAKCDEKVRLLLWGANGYVVQKYPTESGFSEEREIHLPSSVRVGTDFSGKEITVQFNGEIPGVPNANCRRCPWLSLLING